MQIHLLLCKVTGPKIEGHTGASEPRGFQPIPGSLAMENRASGPHPTFCYINSVKPAAGLYPLVSLCLPLDLKHAEPATLMVAPGLTPPAHLHSLWDIRILEISQQVMPLLEGFFFNMSEITALPERQSKLSDIILGNITVQLQSWSHLLLFLFHTILIISDFSEFQKHPLLFKAFVPWCLLFPSVLSVQLLLILQNLWLKMPLLYLPRAGLVVPSSVILSIL